MVVVVDPTAGIIIEEARIYLHNTFAVYLAESQLLRTNLYEPFPTNPSFSRSSSSSSSSNNNNNNNKHLHVGFDQSIPAP
jgi:hypothetical protein